MQRRKFILWMMAIAALVGLASPIRSAIGSRQTSFVHEEGGNLPEGLVAVEYLESTGTQYIDMRISLTSDDIVYVKAMCGNRNSVFGVVETGKMFNLTGSGANSILRFGGSNRSVATSLNTVYDFECGKDFKINGMSAGLRSDEFVGTGNCVMFARRGGSLISDYLVGRIYYLSISRKGVHIKDFIPVRFVNELGENEGGMYDWVSGEVFRNNGQGSFVIGQDI